jgi:hypothetical protein
MAVLPFMERGQISEKYRWDLDYTVTTNLTITSNLIISDYTCPSDNNKNKYNSRNAMAPNRPHNYVVCMGRDGVFHMARRRDNHRNSLIDGTSYDHQSPYNAMFTASSLPPDTSITRPDYPLMPTFTDITDGTSNTIALSETVQGVSSIVTAMGDQRGIPWYGFSCFFNTNQTPNTMIADIGVSYNTAHIKHPIVLLNTSYTDPDGRYMRLSARSWHVGGVNAGLGDGSIRFVPNQINLEVWRAAGSTNGSEISSLP